ncbi:exodeoxyribonuclease V subunit alpha [Methylophaga sp. OBS4]|uniref:exodeoxyribonuclease V subunit alpha n=1 Tax=Methylophaga sp. OBS4 TaxID=2991935 RepID=UPI00225BD0C7|nr:exodeoxyribonuclease V subunit alpha [Methylophaga sp. OBS4]MCX4186662.1 exodeoxyribonuclease V subunit alpha [Methylophaga sp. OBS4]
MTEALNLLRQHGFSELACQFAAYIHRKEDGEHPVISLSAGLLTEAMAQGHVCLNLTNLPESMQHMAELLPDTIQAWQNQLLAGKSVGRPGDYKPLILTEQGLLYLYRFWLDEQDVAKAIQQRLQPVEALNIEQLNQDLADWSNPLDGIDWQKIAVAMALSRHLAVISGGPGTGKTTIVLKILQCLQNQSIQKTPSPSTGEGWGGGDTPIRIGLAAPTGKAAARLQQSISKQQNLEVKTLHRLLGITEHNEQGRYNAERTLPLDVLIIDEASMIDISLMAKLMRAMPSKARLILLGDSQQLASVESGAVLANLSEGQQGQFSNDFIAQFPQLGLARPLDSARGDKEIVMPTPSTMLRTGLAEVSLSRYSESVLTDSFVRLQHSYRFDKDSLIGQLAGLVNLGEADQALALLGAQPEASWLPPEERNLLNSLAQGYQRYIDAVENALLPREVIQAFDSFRVLAALKQGPQSVTSVNRMMTRFLALRGWRTAQTYYPGRPIMITRNDYRQHLFNGDTGMLLRDEDGKLKACFCFDDELRWVGLNRLPAHETVFAMTVHKSQGSEFDAVGILLPEEHSPILNRELLYTAITRARKTLNILATEIALRHTINSRHQRESGLKYQLERDVD